MLIIILHLAVGSSVLEEDECDMTAVCIAANSVFRAASIYGTFRFSQVILSLSDFAFDVV